MTRLSLAARNLVAQDPEVRALLGGPSKKWDTWIFDQKPFVTIEHTSKALVVINEAEEDPMVPGNTSSFTRMVVDVWADSTRNPDGTVHKFDADEKIKTIFMALNKHFHMTNLSVPSSAPAFWGRPGDPHIWGTAEQIASRTGVVVIDSRHFRGPVYSDMRDAEGVRFSSILYTVQYLA